MTVKVTATGNIGRKEKSGNQHFILVVFSPFSIMFSKGFLYRVVKSPDCVVKSFNHLLCGVFLCDGGSTFNVSFV